MDRITQLQDEIQQVCLLPPYRRARLSLSTQILTIMSRSIQYLTSKADFVQISPEVPVTKQRAAGKADPPDVFDGQALFAGSLASHPQLPSLTKQIRRNW